MSPNIEMNENPEQRYFRFRNAAIGPCLVATLGSLETLIREISYHNGRFEGLIYGKVDDYPAIMELKDKSEQERTKLIEAYSEILVTTMLEVQVSSEHKRLVKDFEAELQADKMFRLKNNLTPRFTNDVGKNVIRAPNDAKIILSHIRSLPKSGYPWLQRYLPPPEWKKNFDHRSAFFQFHISNGIRLIYVFELWGGERFDLHTYLQQDEFSHFRFPITSLFRLPAFGVDINDPVSLNSWLTEILELSNQFCECAAPIIESLPECH